MRSADTGLGSPVKEVVTEPTRGVLDGQPLRLRVRADIDGLHGNRDAEAFGEIAAELLVPRRRAAKTMVQVSEGNDAEALLLREFLQQERQGDGIRSAGEADQQSGAARAEPVPADGSANLLMKSAQVVDSPTRNCHEASHAPGMRRRLEVRVVPEGGLEPPTPRL